MQIIPFTKNYQQETATFMDKIWDEMGLIDDGWKVKPKNGFAHLDTFFHMPNDGFLLLMKDNNKIIGTGGCVCINRTDALLKRFYIDKDYRGTGVADKLFEAIVTATKILKSSRIVIDVSKDNGRAIHFYEKCGFMPYNPEVNAQWPESYKPEVFNYYFLPIE